MSTVLNGLADADIQVVDVSFLIQSGLTGITAMLGVTERGDPNDPINGLCGSWIEFTRKFGGYRSDSLFPLICKRALDSGCPLRISRVEHYSDPTDKSTATGVLATMTAADQIPTIASASGVTTGGTLPSGTRKYKLVGVYADLSLSAPSAEGSVTNTGSTSKNTIVGNPLPGAVSYRLYYGTAANAEDHYLSGSTPNFTDDGTAGLAGVPPTPGNSSVLNARNAGTWANGTLTVTILPAISGASGKVDITVSLAGYEDLDQTVQDVTAAIATDEKTAVNAGLNFMQIGTVTAALPIGIFNTFASGAAPASAIVAADYIGDSVQGSGLYSFDGSRDFTKLAIPEMAQGVIDAAIDAYQRLRGDFIGLIRTPTGLSGTSVLDYRNKTGAYASTAPVIDNAYMFMFTGGLKIIDPTDPLGKRVINISELGDVAGAIASKDTKNYQWFSFAGSKRGVIKNAVGIVYDLGTPAREGDAAAVDQAGVNCIVNNEFGNVIWGNGTLQKANTLLKKAEVAELIMFIKRVVKPAIRVDLFDPNDVDTWQDIYKRVKKIMDTVKTNRGIWKYLYQGDQDITDISKAVINTSDNVDAGKYVFYLWVAPKVAMKYIGVKVVVTNSSVDFSLASNNVSALSA